MNTSQVIQPLVISLPECQHFTDYQVKKLVRDFAGEHNAQAYRDTMNALNWALHSLIETLERCPDRAEDIKALHEAIHRIYGVLIPDHRRAIDNGFGLPPYRREFDSFLYNN